MSECPIQDCVCEKDGEWKIGSHKIIKDLQQQLTSKADELAEAKAENSNNYYKEFIDLQESLQHERNENERLKGEMRLNAMSWICSKCHKKQEAKGE